MLEFVNRYGSNYTSQFREDGIVEEVFRRIGITSGTVAECGAHNGFYCSNTRKWIEAGFASVLIEGDAGLCAQIPRREDCQIINAFLTAENVNELVPKDLTMLVLDVDGLDYGIWQAYKGMPDVVIIEINSSYTPYVYAPINDKNYGTAYLPMTMLGIWKFYFLLCHTGNEIFILNIHRHLFPEILGDGIDNCELYFNTDHLPK